MDAESQPMPEKVTENLTADRPKILMEDIDTDTLLQLHEILMEENKPDKDCDSSLDTEASEGVITTSAGEFNQIRELFSPNIETANSTNPELKGQSQNPMEHDGQTGVIDKASAKHDTHQHVYATTQEQQMQTSQHTPGGATTASPRCEKESVNNDGQESVVMKGSKKRKKDDNCT